MIRNMKLKKMESVELMTELEFCSLRHMTAKTGTDLPSIAARKLWKARLEAYQFELEHRVAENTTIDKLPSSNDPVKPVKQPESMASGLEDDDGEDDDVKKH